LSQSISIYYDGDCPFCKKYTKLVRLREAVADVRLVDLRRDSEHRQRFVAEGIDLDKGMVVEFDGRTYHGDKAMWLLATLSGKSNFFNRFNFFLFSNAWLSALLYPLLRLCRNTVLLVLGRQSLAVDNEGIARHFALFCFGWGVFSCLAFIIYAAKYNAELYPSTWLMLVLGFLLVLFPGNKRIFLALVAVQIVDGVLQMPIYSNHTILKNFFLLAVLAGGIIHALAGNSWQRFFVSIQPVGRALLAIMYVFGVWHKINSGFLDPEASCARALWEKMPLFFSVFDHQAVYFAGIYGTLVIETVILACLLIPRVRWIGIVAGILFHSMLAMSQYAFYSSFSMLTVALHLLFVSPASAVVITQSRQWRKLVETPLLLRALAYGLWFGFIGWLAWHGLYTAAAAIWLLGMLMFFVAVSNHARDADDRGVGEMLVSPTRVVNIVTLLFFFNCITPYLGLKTAQSMNMFANLRLEGGESNHLILRNAPGPFEYLDDIAEITSAYGNLHLAYIQHSGLRIVYYQLLDILEKNPDVKVSFIRKGVMHENQTGETLRDDIDQILHPRWFRKWFHFTPVEIQAPKPCSPTS